MQEAQVLCQRIGIIHKGILRCLGSAQHLKTKFVRGYRVTFLFSELASALQNEVSLLDPTFTTIVDMPGVLTVAINWRAPAYELFIRLEDIKKKTSFGRFYSFAL